MCLSCVMSLVTSRVIPQWSTESAGPGSVQLSSCPTRGPLLWVTSIPNRAPWFWRALGQTDHSGGTDRWNGVTNRHWTMRRLLCWLAAQMICFISQVQRFELNILRPSPWSSKEREEKGGRDGECGEGTERGEVRSWVRTSTQHSCHNWYVIQLHTTAAWTDLLLCNYSLLRWSTTTIILS